ncbi:hypothetical protein E2R51_03710 [Jeotgalibacillus sp. S-D1]|uniref:ATP-binding protein n=1 Tax=Jeotgalibacillus sp. S-D1 TaxID=2552189 RepID=UPI00105A667D|nr:ATP-binding protein [Jeotgalibacillus sp. S-D1]TDL34838.1 hypothetical protein E2R51_03710 [Jeotgalibacillus sp. S-D1]
MEFTLLIAISLIPVILGFSILFYSRISITKALSVFLFLLCAWQVDIAFLYANDFLDQEVIDLVFRIFRFGNIMIMPLMYYFGYHLVLNHSELKPFHIYFNKYGLTALVVFSIIVYMINFTDIGIMTYSLVPETTFAPSHLIPVYGALNIAFIINIVFVFTNTLFLMVITIKLKDYFYKIFYTKVAFGALFVFLNGAISAFGFFPLYFSSFNSILIAIILFLGFFQMQSQKLNQANTRLYKQSSLLETIMNINPNYLVVLNKNNTMIKLNDSVCSLLSIKREDMAGKHFSYLKQHSNLEVETQKIQRLINSNGDIHYVQWGYRSLEYNDEELYTLFYGIDYTNQKQNEQLLLTTEKSKVIGELAASIAHEIRNPLATVRGFIQLLKERSVDSRYENIILDEIDRINDVLKELLLLAKPEANDASGATESLSIDVFKEIENIILLFEAVANEQNKHIYVTNALQAYTHTVFQRSHFKQVLINIIRNSLESLPAKGNIKIKLDEVGGSIRIRIIDDGKGISKERLKRIGEPYYTNKEKGTEIGLTICFKLIQDYSGQMKVKSKIGWGTTVTILLPCSD